MSRLTEIRERASKATGGKWWWISENGITRLLNRRCRPWSTVIDGDMWANRDDQAFIAHSREDIPFLLELVTEAEQIIFTYAGQHGKDWLRKASE